ncbi:MAG: LysM peptidoglycan-binding domain-containing protein [Anaerolineaceae bacterium]|nr:LysM peptidoglycan-binding domain-containing protein [Anaerolineaceae bacterium]
MLSIFSNLSPDQEGIGASFLLHNLRTRLCRMWLIASILIGSFFPSACSPENTFEETNLTGLIEAGSDAEELSPAQTARPNYSPGELVEYEAQTGDTLPALASHFNTTVEEIRDANPILPTEVTTLPPGLPMQIPIYYQSLWGSQYQILPDSLFINGPAQIGFNIVEYIDSQPGWFKDYSHFAGDRVRRGGELIQHVANNFSISPRLLISLIEYQTGAVSRITPPSEDDQYPLGLNDPAHQGLYRQLVLAANILNNSYYDWRTGDLKFFEHNDGRLEIPDPWQNAASVALQYYFAQTLSRDEYILATHQDGFYRTYQELFGDPWEADEPHIPGSLQQPEMKLPFEKGYAWAFTGGPHTGWGEGAPLAALDFAPPAVVGGCSPTEEWATAVASGEVVRTGIAIVLLDLDGDGYEQTGWVVFYLHLGTKNMAEEGQYLNAGDPVGHPSCEGGRSTGTHVHIARKYNGEWISAAGPLAFNLESWIAYNGDVPYHGTLEHFGRVVRACVCSDQLSQIMAGEWE